MEQWEQCLKRTDLNINIWTDLREGRLSRGVKLCSLCEMGTMVLRLHETCFMLPSISSCYYGAKRIIIWYSPIILASYVIYRNILRVRL
jgi:hypothetical protein